MLIEISTEKKFAFVKSTEKIAFVFSWVEMS